MTQDYWGPLFDNTSLIPVSFLNPKAAAQLITNPSPDYDQEAIKILQTLCTKPLSIDQLAIKTNQNPEQLQAALNTLIDHDVIYLQDHQYIYKVEPMRRWVAAQKF
jgi:predicted Rossmann fold nucleotide-binding protein DprA/Smf involved in DNA uptake